MAEAAGQERTERATAKRRQEARRRGQVALSREIPSTLLLFTLLGVLVFGGSALLDRSTRLVGGIYARLHTLRIGRLEDASALLSELAGEVLALLAPVCLPLLVAGFLGNVFQIGVEFHAEALQPKWSKLNPLAGLKRIFSLRGAFELAKSLIKLALVGSVAAAVVWGMRSEMPTLVRLDLGSIRGFAFEGVTLILLFSGIAMTLLAALDTLYQRWQYEENLKMTKQEVKDERRQTEGDPAVKARIRSIQRQVAYRRMMAEVPRADVVVVNPTHLAVALRFDPAVMVAPKVVAKGADHVAERIRRIASEHGVPIVENPPLARSLFRLTDIGDTVPVELYRVVAEVLAYVYRLKGRSRL